MQGPLGVTESLEVSGSQGSPQGVPSRRWEKQKRWWRPLVALSATAGDWEPESEPQGPAGKEWS